MSFYTRLVLSNEEGHMRKLGLLTLTCLFFAVGCSQPRNAGAQPQLSATAFRDAVADEILRQRPGLCIQRPNDFSLRVGRTQQNCSEAVVNTNYAFHQYSGDPSQLQIYVAQLTSTALAAVRSLDAGAFVPDRRRLLVVVRPTAYAATVRPSPTASGGIWRAFVGDLIAILVQKDGEQIRSLVPEDLVALELSESAAWDLALTNLRAQIGALERAANSDGAEVVTASSGLALSNLLLPETCKTGGPNFDAFVVDRNTYFSADQRVPSATSMLAGYSGQLVQTGQTYSDQLISCIDGRWYASVFNGQNTWFPAEQAAPVGGGRP